MSAAFFVPGRRRRKRAAGTKQICRLSRAERNKMKTTNFGPVTHNPQSIRNG